MSDRYIFVNRQTKPSTCPVCRTPNSFDERGANYVCRTCGHSISRGEAFSQAQDELQQTQGELQRLKAELQQTQSTLRQTQTELNQARRNTQNQGHSNIRNKKTSFNFADGVLPFIVGGVIGLGGVGLAVLLEYLFPDYESIIWISFWSVFIVFDIVMLKALWDDGLGWRIYSIILLINSVFWWIAYVFII